MQKPDKDDIIPPTRIGVIALIMSLALTYSARAIVTNEVDIAALAACGTGTTNGWTLVGIDSSTD